MFNLTDEQIKLAIFENIKAQILSFSEESMNNIIKDTLNNVMNKKVDKFGMIPQYSSSTDKPLIEHLFNKTVQDCVTEVVNEHIKEHKVALKEILKNKIGESTDIFVKIITDKIDKHFECALGMNVDFSITHVPCAHCDCGN